MGTLQESDPGQNPVFLCFEGPDGLLQLLVSNINGRQMAVGNHTPGMAPPLAADVADDPLTANETARKLHTAAGGG